jgi:hypothetical protein
MDPCIVVKSWLDYGRSLHAYVNRRLQIELELLMMSGGPLETCWAFNERRNNKFYYKVASCWLFLLRTVTNYANQVVTPEMYLNVYGIHRHFTHCRVYRRPIGQICNKYFPSVTLYLLFHTYFLAFNVQENCLQRSS